ncbi:MAG: hypothetical protein M3347_14165, partial [Armatimonadota bacterium]|nr:hypothetical protein [Armatimonadota bacterium]
GGARGGGFWRSTKLWLLLTLLLTQFHPSHAQLATSYYNVTSIQKRVLPNAVQLTIRTDGTVLFGGDLDEIVDISEVRFQPKPVTSFRLRLLNARARLPAFVDIGAYPVDSAAVTLGSDEFKQPFFSSGADDQRGPRVDIQFKFYVPVTVQSFVIDRRSTDFLRGENAGEYGINFTDVLGPRDVRVELGPDRRTIIITVIPDRADAGRAARIRRSPPEQHKHRLLVTPIPASLPESGGLASPLLPRLRIDVLHTRLAEVLDAVSRATDVSLTIPTDAPSLSADAASERAKTGNIRANAADIDVSLLLPNVTLDECLRAISTAYGLVVTPRVEEEGGGFSVGRGNPVAGLERFQLHHLAPERARLLFPDFLLPYLRVDNENNALLFSGSPELAARLRHDLARLDLPRPQVRVEATAWEFSSSADANYALRLIHSLARQSTSLDTGAGTVSFILGPAQQKLFSATVEALAAKGRARLSAKPFVVVASGEEGSLFLGQERFVTVLRRRRGVQNAEALRLQVGYSITVTPRVGARDDITLDLNPRVSTIDAIEPDTRLPTLGVRETTSVARVRPDDAVIIGGLESNLEFATRRRLLPLAPLPVVNDLLGSRRSSTSQTALIMLVTARKV